MGKMEDNSSTGIEELDRDLDAYFALLKSPRLGDVADLFKDESRSIADIRAVMSDGIIKLLLVLADPISYSVLIKRCNESGKRRLEDAHKSVKKHFPRIRYHPAIVDFAAQAAGSDARDDDKEELKFNTISSIGHARFYFGEPPNLLPVLRIAFRNNRGKLLLDSTMDWDDMLFVSKVLANILVDEFKVAMQLKDAEMLTSDKEFREKIAKHISDLSTYINQLDSLANEIGIKAIRD